MKGVGSAYLIFPVELLIMHEQETTIRDKSLFLKFEDARVTYNWYGKIAHTLVYLEINVDKNDSKANA